MLIVAKTSKTRKNGGSMNNTVSIETIADWFLNKEAMTHKKLQKLCYYAVAWGWALMNRNVARNGEFQAWVHGPVSPILYRKYKDNGWNELNRVKTQPQVPNDIGELLEAVWFTYGSKSGNELEALSHSEGPWIAARGGLQPDKSCTQPISTEVMREFYTSIKSADY